MTSRSSARSLLRVSAFALSVAGVIAGCGASGDVDATPEEETKPTQKTPPPASTDTAPTDTDSGTPPAGPQREKCGAAPYTWIQASVLGDVLETKPAPSYNKLILQALIEKAKKDGAFKTRRVAAHNTQSKVLRYQTQDRGKLIDATTLVATPSDGGTYPIMLVLHGTAGFTDACAPSSGVVTDPIGGITDPTAGLLSLFASFGYIAVAPDYIGLKSLGMPTGFLHPYLVGEPTAIASLDAVRAAKKDLAGSKFTPGELVVMGGSQGGHAAAFVNRYQPHYAPELSIKGSVWDVPPTNILGEARPALASWTNPTKNMVAATTTYQSWYASAPLSEAFLPPYDTSVPAALASSCSSSSALDDATLETVFTPEFLAASQQDDFGGKQPWLCYYKENTLELTSVPRLDTIPSLFLLGEQDQLVNTAVERESFKTLCSQGHVLQYLECAGATHTKPLSYAFDQWLDFLEDRLAGKALADSCNVHPAETCTSTPD